MQVVVGILWAVAGLCVIAVIYPYVLYPLLLRTLTSRPVHAGDILSDSGTEFALLFSAYNEAKALPDNIANLRELRTFYPDLEVLAYDLI